MKRSLSFVIFLAALLSSLALAQQPASAEFLGVATTLPHSRGVSGWLADGSVGEATFVVIARDAAGNPLAGVPVTWTLTNSGSSLAYVVASSAGGQLGKAYPKVKATINGGVTGADGRAFIVLDSLTAGDLSASASVGGLPAKTYDGGDQRVVWF